MSFHRFLSDEGKAEVRAAKKRSSAAARTRKADRARNLEVAREAMKGAENKFRQPRERDPKFLSWLRKAPCLVCAIQGDVQATRTDPAHVRRAYPEPGWRPVGGAEKPSDFRAAPLCRRHHEEQHEHDSHNWYADYGIYPPDVCATLKAAQVNGDAPADTIHEISSAIKLNMLEVTPK